MVLTLPDSEAALSNQLGSKLRSQIRRAEREEIELTWGGAQRIADFYRVFAPAMHDLGTPVYPRRFFEIV
jgi:serine/alanine adding enzyme